jgi:Protein of unknown function (DUF2783)
VLVIDPNVARPDEAYAMILAAHEGLSVDESHALNARLVLILANHVGQMDVLAQALELARKTGHRSEGQ